MIGGAWISEDGRYRYRLTRRFGVGRDLVFVMLNPSTADAHHVDPTIRKCCGFAARMDYGGIEVVNLFAYRATHPKALYDLPMAALTGPENRAAMNAAFHRSHVILAWGAHARRWPKYAQSIETLARQLASDVRALFRLSDGTPAHPLMLPYSCIETPEKQQQVLTLDGRQGGA